MKDLVAAFMPKFVASAQTRLARTLDLAGKRTGADAVAIARELHAIAGEAGLLGITNIVTHARTAEDHAKKLRASATDDSVDALLTALHDLRRAIELVSQPERTA